MNSALGLSPPVRLILPSGWQTIQRDGFLVQVDPHRQSPLAFALSVVAGLDSRPRRLDASYLYDTAGSDLFERITAQPEYYLTRVEDRMLAQHAAAIRALAGPGLLVELGSGASTKTQRLLDAWTAAGPSSYVPIDVDANSVEQACRTLRRLYPSLALQGVAATYERGLALLQDASPMTVTFLGSSLGNLGWKEYPEFCQTVADALRDGDHFLVGLDLVKNPAEIEAAYNDAAGVTAAFTKNLFRRMNRELETDIPEGAIQHVAFYDSDRERIEIFAEALQELDISVPQLGRTFRIARGERILTEVSHKFRAEAAIATVERYGFQLSWKDEGGGQFGLFLFRKKRAGSGAATGSSPTASVDARVAAGLAAHLGVLAEMRARTLQIVASLREEDLQRQHSPLMSPLIWDLGHIAHFEELWLLPAVNRPPDPEEALARVYDPLATPRARRARLALPSVADVRQRMAEVRQRVQQELASPAAARLDAAGSSPVLDREFALQLVAQHEAQHQETMLQAIALREDLDYRPLGDRRRTPPGAEVAPGDARQSVTTSSALSRSGFVPVGSISRPDAPGMQLSPRGSRSIAETVLVPGGPFIMGTNDREWTYDNERPAHEVDVPAFRMDRAPVSNGQYLAFMRDGGYTRPALWPEASWAWVQKSGAQAPAHWRPTERPSQPTEQSSRAAAGTPPGWQAVVFGRREPLHPDHPVVHVSWHEAAAYARWAGGRLPTEAEWEKAAAWDPARDCSRRYPWGDARWEAGCANLDQLFLEPINVGAYPKGQSAYGCVQMLGDVWEWTDSWFDSYPGFESFPYKEYSEIFFGATYRVLRGGSFATRAAVARNTFRNWDLPERRQIFSGFRCAYPA